LGAQFDSHACSNYAADKYEVLAAEINVYACIVSPFGIFLRVPSEKENDVDHDVGSILDKL